MYPSAVAIWATLIAVGGVEAAFALTVTVASRRVFCLRFYALFMSLLTLAEIAVAILFNVPSTQQKVIDAANLPDNLKTQLESNLSVAGWVLVAVSSLQALALLLVFGQCAAVDRGFQEDDASTSLVARDWVSARNASAGKGAAPGRVDPSYSAADEARSARVASKQGAIAAKYGFS